MYILKIKVLFKQGFEHSLKELCYGTFQQSKEEAKKILQKWDNTFNMLIIEIEENGSILWEGEK